MTSIRSIYGLNSYNPMSRKNLGLGMANSTPSTINLPNGGGSYEYPGIFNGQTDPNITPPPAVEQPPVVQTQAPATTAPPVRSKYINPATGEYFQTAEEYGTYVGSKLPASKGNIPQYANDAMMDPNQSATNLESTARNLNNARNDIATGTTDPYGVGNKSGIAYSPQELKAIESAYAGVYDPALNDVFARLKEKQTSDKEEQDKKDWREERIFATNESIRQWKATTGTKSTTEDNVINISDSSLLDGASRAAMTPGNFKKLDPAVQNYYINRPKSYNSEDKEFNYIDETFELFLAEIEAGKMTSAEVAEKIMEGKNLDNTVKLYLVGLLPRQKEIPFDATKLGIALNTVTGIPQVIREMFPF